MKKLALLMMALFVSVSMFSQKSYRAFGWKLTRDLPKNELKLNLGTTIFGSYPEITYERILAPDLSLGVSAGVSLESDTYLFNYSVLPYARWFFGGNAENLRKYGAGFFIELNGGVFSMNITELDYSDNNNFFTENGETGAGLGLAVGWKYLSQNNWVGEIYLGGGRDFVNDFGYPRVGITVGKRF